MIRVIECTNDKKMYSLCSDRVKSTYKFVRFLVEKFSDDLDFVRGVGDSYLEVTTNKIERNGNIIWISIKENNKLQQIHNKLDLLLLNYGISKHEFDDNFMFHSTLFIDENEEKIKEMYDVIKDVDVSDNIKVDSIIMGESEDGINFIPILDIVVKG